MKILNKMLGAAALILASAMPVAQADVVYEFTNLNRTDESPSLGFADDFVFAKATFQLLGTDDLRLTLWVAPEMGTTDVTAWYFNIVGVNLAVGDFTSGGGVTDWTVQTIIPGPCTPCTADGTGEYDFKIDFSNSQLSGGLSAIIDIDAATALSLSMFDDAESYPDGFGAAIHVQRIGTADLSGWWTANCIPAAGEEECGGDGSGNEQEIPEPGTLAILGVGLIGLAYARRRRSH